MYTTINCSIIIAYKISKSKKDFFLYDIDKETNTIKNYILTNDLKRYRKEYESFKLVEIIKTDIKTNINTITF